MTLCQACGQPLPADPVQAEIHRIEKWCRENSVRVIAGHFLRLEGVAELLACTPSTVHRRISAGQINPTILLGRRHVDLSELARLILESENSFSQTDAK